MSRILHVFCGPFPTAQGTQTLVRQTACACAAAGHETTLLTYAHGHPPAAYPFSLQRIPDLPPFHSERSGPALAKPFLDASMALHIRRLLHRWSPHLIHAHHYEALVACRIADPRRHIPLLFHQHALFAPELPTYGPPRLRPLLSALGRLTDHCFPRTADLTLTVSPVNQRHMLAAGISPARLDLLLPPAMDLPEAHHRPVSRTTEPLTLAYIGNLDPYQDLPLLLEALQHANDESRHPVLLHIITDSRPISIEPTLRSRVRFGTHGTFEHAYRQLIAADICVIPRSRSGGIPIKLVAALCAGMPVILHPAPIAGLDLQDVTHPVDTTDAHAFAHAIASLRPLGRRRQLHTSALQAAARLFATAEHERRLHHIYTGLIAKTTYRRK